MHRSAYAWIGEKRYRHSSAPSPGASRAPSSALKKGLRAVPRGVVDKARSRGRLTLPMRPALAAFAALVLIAAAAPALAITGKAPPADGVVARAIVMLIDDKQDLCTATVLARDLVLTAAHCVAAKKRKRAVKLYQTGETIPVRAVVPHPRFDIKAYARARATADIALVTLERPL